MVYLVFLEAASGDFYEIVLFVFKECGFFLHFSIQSPLCLSRVKYSVEICGGGQRMVVAQLP